MTCTFRPQTKFDPAVNAKFNDAKGDSLCKKGLARYLKVGTNETLAVFGQYSAAPVATVGDRLCYSFGVPVAGCEVRKVVPMSTPLPEVASKTTSVTRSSSFLCVTEYREVNGERTTVSRREYQGRNFKSPKEFDRFCRQEFARIRALGEANIRAVRELGK